MGLLSQASASPLVQGSNILWCKDPGKDAFLFALSNAPYFLYETTQAHPPYTANASFACQASPDALFLLTTLTCYRAPVAEWLSQALASHYRFPYALAMRIRTALHEAIANAVIHGNLGIHERFEDREGFDAYYARIHTRLSHPQYRSTRICVTLVHCRRGITLGVSDEGEGYESGMGCRRDDVFPLGQGLAVIREQCSATRILQGGSAIEMDFAV